MKYLSIKKIAIDFIYLITNLCVTITKINNVFNNMYTHEECGI